MLLRNAGVQPGILHGVTTQKTTIETNRTVKTSNSTNLSGVGPAHLSSFGESFRISLELKTMKIGQYNDSQPIKDVHTTNPQTSCVAH
jgi:hypothetical protein